MKEAEEQIFLVCGAMAIVALAIFWNAYIAVILWDWFVSPLGVLKVSYGHMVGLMCVVGLFIRYTPTKEELPPWRVLFRAFGAPLVPLFIGFIAKAFM